MGNGSGGDLGVTDGVTVDTCGRGEHPATAMDMAIPTMRLVY